MDELDRLRKLSGIGQYKNSFEGSNISITGDEKGRIMKDKKIRPGSPEWFKLWFSKPYLTGEKPV